MHMLRLLPASRFWLAPCAATILAGCSVIADVETYDAVETGRYSSAAEDSVLAFMPYGQECRWPCYRIGLSSVFLYPASRGDNLIAIGPILPILPAPGSGSDYDEANFFITVHVRPGNVSLVIFSPGDFQIRQADDAPPIAPNKVSDCEDGKPSPDIVRIFGETQCVRIEFPVTHGDLEEFVLIPALFESDGATHALPDLKWRPWTYRVVE